MRISIKELWRCKYALIMIETGKMPEDMRIKLMKKITEVSSEIIGIPEDSIYVFVKELVIYAK